MFLVIGKEVWNFRLIVQANENRWTENGANGSKIPPPPPVVLKCSRNIVLDHQIHKIIKSIESLEKVL